MGTCRVPGHPHRAATPAAPATSLTEAAQPPSCPPNCPPPLSPRTRVSGHQSREADRGSFWVSLCAAWSVNGRGFAYIWGWGWPGEAKGQFLVSNRTPGLWEEVDIHVHAHPPTQGRAGATPGGWGDGQGSALCSPHTHPPPLPSPLPVVPAAVTDPRVGAAWALGSPGSRASGPAVAGEAMSVLGTNSCRPGSPPPSPEQVCPPWPSLACQGPVPGVPGPPHPHLLGPGGALGWD